MKNDNSRGFCIFYDWLAVFEMLKKEDVADLVLAIGRYYTEGADILEGVSDSTKPLATLIAQQLERARENKAAKTTFVRTGSKNKTKTKSKTKTEAETNTETETKTKTKTEADTNTETETKTKTEAETNTETETEKNKETKQNPRVRVGEERLLGGALGGGGEREKLSFSDRGMQLTPPTLADVESYVRDNKLDFVNARQFFDYNERRGWRIDGEPVRDWQSLISIWNSKDAPTREKPREEKQRYGDFDINEAFQRALERSYGKKA